MPKDVLMVKNKKAVGRDIKKWINVTVSPYCIRSPIDYLKMYPTISLHSVPRAPPQAPGSQLHNVTVPQWPNVKIQDTGYIANLGTRQDSNLKFEAD